MSIATDMDDLAGQAAYRINARMVHVAGLSFFMLAAQFITVIMAASSMAPATI